jgi:hypothetical protein
MNENPIAQSFIDELRITGDEGKFRETGSIHD